MRGRLVAVGLALVLAGVVAAEVKVGDVRAVQSREGTALRAEPRAIGARIAVLPYKTPLMVLEVRGLLARVRTQEGAEGWVRQGEIVEPGALTGATAGESASSTVSLAGRQFDDAVEQDFRKTAPNLEPAYRLLDALEKKGPQPGDAEVERFIAEGRLGRGL